MLEISKLGISFNIDNSSLEILKDINITVNKGEFVAILGHSGCGKSTLLKIIAGLEKESTGNVFLNSKDILGPSKERAMVFQENRLLPWLTIEKNIDIVLQGVSKSNKAKRIDYYLKLVGLEDFKKAFPHQISGGMAQRAAIARALVNNPEIILLDEPFGALDALIKIILQKEILKIWGKEKNTMIMVTHDIDEAIFLADKIVLMTERPGRVKEIINVDLPRPRDRSNSEFTNIKRKIYKHFFNDDEMLIEYNI